MELFLKIISTILLFAGFFTCTGLLKESSGYNRIAFSRDVLTTVQSVILLSIYFPPLNLVEILHHFTAPLTDFIIELCVSGGGAEEVPGRDLPVSDLIVEPCVSGETAEEVPSQGLPLSGLIVEPCVSGETEEVPIEGLRLSDVEPFMSAETARKCGGVLTIVLLVTTGLVFISSAISK